MNLAVTTSSYKIYSLVFGDNLYVEICPRCNMSSSAITVIKHNIYYCIDCLMNAFPVNLVC